MPPTAAVPLGSFWDAHFLPPSVVLSMTAAAPEGGLPEAQHSDVLGQDNALRSFSGLGRARASETHVLPPFVVATTSPSPDVVAPAAQQSVLVAHETLYSGPVPDGTRCSFHTAPASVVATTMPVLEGVSPTAQQSELLRHVTLNRNSSGTRDGGFSVFHLPPASLVPSKPPAPDDTKPTLKQLVVVGQ